MRRLVTLMIMLGAFAVTGCVLRYAGRRRAAGEAVSPALPWVGLGSMVLGTILILVVG